MIAAILWAELKRGLKNHLAYPFQAACEVITVGFIAVAAPSLLEGVSLTGIPDAVVERPEKTVALMMVFAALVGLQIAHRIVREESDLGTLEQLCLAPVGLPSLVMFRCAADTLRMIPVVLMIAGLVAPRGHVAESLVMISVIILLMNIGMLGIGFFLGSLTLLVKRTGFIPNLISLILFPLALSSPDQMPEIVQSIGFVVPFTQAVRLLEAAFYCACVSSWVLNLGKLCALSGLWLTAGICCFRQAERFARERGLLGTH